MLRLIAGLAALVSVGLALAPGGARRSAAVTPGVTITVSSHELRCDGDSAWLTVRAADGDGAPLADKPVSVHISPGNASIPSDGISGETVEGETNPHGIFRALVTPEPGTTGKYLLVVGVDEQRFGPWFEPCPYSDDETYTLRVHAFGDADADGVEDDNERPLRGRKLALAGGGLSFGTQEPPHLARTDSEGNVGWSGLHQYYDGFFRWRICVPEEGPGSEMRIVSLDGAAASPSPCVTLLELAAGETRVAVGVQ